MPFCEFCQARFSSDRGLWSHQAHCTGQEIILQRSLLKRRTKMVVEDSPEIMNVKRGRVEVDDDSEMRADNGTDPVRT